MDPKNYSIAGSPVPVAAAVRRRVRVEMLPEDEKTVRDAGLTGGEGATAAGSVISAG